MRTHAYWFVLVATASAQDIPLVFDLNEAILKDDVAGIEAMIRDGVSINGKDLDSRTPLTVAAFHGKADIVKKLLAAGAETGIRGLSGMTPVAAAASSGDPRTLELILNVTEDPGAPRAALINAIGQGGLLDLVRILLEGGADPGRTRGDATPLHLAAASGLVDIVDLLLQYGADPMGLNEKGKSAVYAAVGARRHEVLPLLLSRGADPDWIDPSTGWTALDLAVSGGDAECTRALIAYGADVNSVNKAGSAAIHIAARGPWPSIVDLLVTSSANVDVRDADGATPLFLAVAAGRSESVKRLLAAEADTGIATAQGVTPLDQARKMQRADLVDLLE